MTINDFRVIEKTAKEVRCHEGGNKFMRVAIIDEWNCVSAFYEDNNLVIINEYKDDHGCVEAARKFCEVVIPRPVAGTFDHFLHNGKTSR